MPIVVTTHGLEFSVEVESHWHEDQDQVTGVSVNLLESAPMFDTLKRLAPVGVAYSFPWSFVTNIEAEEFNVAYYCKALDLEEASADELLAIVVYAFSPKDTQWVLAPEDFNRARPILARWFEVKRQQLESQLKSLNTTKEFCRIPPPPSAL